MVLQTLLRSGLVSDSVSSCNPEPLCSVKHILVNNTIFAMKYDFASAVKHHAKSNI